MKLPDSVRWFRWTAIPLVVFVAVGCGKKTTAPPPPGNATLIVHSSPAGAGVRATVNQAFVASPATLTIAAGDYSVLIRDLGYRDSTVSVHLAANETRTVTVALTPLPGTPQTFGQWSTAPLTGRTIVGMDMGPSGSVFVCATDVQRTTTYFWIHAQDGSVTGPFQAANPGGPIIAQDMAVKRADDNGNLSPEIYVTYYESQGVGFNGWFIDGYSSSGALLNQPRWKDPHGALGQFPGDAPLQPFGSQPVLATGENDPGTLDIVVDDNNNPFYRGIFGQVNAYWYGDVGSVIQYTLGHKVSDVAVSATESPVGTTYLIGRETDSLYVYSGAGFLQGWPSGVGRITGGGIAERYIAASADGSVYAAGWSERASGGIGGDIMRRFTSTGAILGEWALDSSVRSKGFTVDANGRIYLAGPGGSIVRYVP